PAANQVAISFLPAGPGQPPPVIVPSGAITVANCSATCPTLRFVMPSTPSLAGPAAITVTVGATVVASIDALFQAHDVTATCDKLAETIFENFTVLPTPNDFGAL